VEDARDTRPEAARIQHEIWRRMGGARRVELALQMSEEAREVAIAGVRARHPEYSADQALHALLRVQLGDALYEQAWPGRGRLAP
jgi:hypothetical protein